MEIREALKIIRTLADAMRPAEQQDREDELVCQQLEAEQALAMAAAALEAEEKRLIRKRYSPLKVGEPWLAAEEEQLRAEFARRMTIQEMARSHQRLRGGITARLEKLGLISSQLAMNFTAPFGVPLPNKHSAAEENVATAGEARRLPPRSLERPWLLIEDAILCDNFGSIDLDQIAIRLGRTRISVESRLVRLGKIGSKPRSDAA